MAVALGWQPAHCPSNEGWTLVAGWQMMGDLVPMRQPQPHHCQNMAPPGVRKMQMIRLSPVAPRRPDRSTSPQLLFAAATLALLALLQSSVAQAATTTGPKALNDTGATQCYVNKVLTTDCAGTGQDADFGRDVRYPDDSDGRAGFSFRKVCNTGEFAGTGNCPVDPPLGAGPNDWGCTHDRVTKLTWEVKTNDGGFRDGGKFYSNYMDGRVGDAFEYRNAINQMGLCGSSDWRVPSVSELLTIFDFGVIASAPIVDGKWFPFASSSYWTSNAQQPSYDAWTISNGMVRATLPLVLNHVILVR